MSPACSASISATTCPGGWDARARGGGRRDHRPCRPLRAGLRRQSVVGRLALSPLDLERRFGLIGGDIFHGKMGLDQLFSNRPMLGHADYRMPLAGPLSVRLRRASRRRRHRRARPQCRRRRSSPTGAGSSSERYLRGPISIGTAAEAPAAGSNGKHGKGSRRYACATTGTSPPAPALIARTVYRGVETMDLRRLCRRADGFVHPADGRPGRRPIERLPPWSDRSIRTARCPADPRRAAQLPRCPRATCARPASRAATA